jgi:hypothetical protein
LAFGCLFWLGLGDPVGDIIGIVFFHKEAHFIAVASVS